MDSIINNLNQLIEQLKTHAHMAFIIVGVLWAVHLINFISKYGFNYLGIRPRTPFGLLGIPCSPFLHSDFNHLLMNSIPLFFFANFLLITGFNYFLIVTIVIGLLTGIGVWLVGRKAIHIGASGIIMGYFSFLLLNAYYQKSGIAILIAIMVLYYFSSLFLGLFKISKGVSYEAHLLGFTAGIAAVYLVPMVIHNSPWR